MPSKTWVVGEEVLAADFNAYVQEQVVATFPTSAARSTAIPSPKEGMVTYLVDTKRLEHYNGTAWTSTLVAPTAAIIGTTPTRQQFVYAGTQQVPIGNAAGATNITIPAGTFTQGITSVVLTPRYDDLAGGPASLMPLWANSNLTTIQVICLRANGTPVAVTWVVGISFVIVGA